MSFHHGTGAQRRATDRGLFNGLRASTPKHILNLPAVDENAPEAKITDTEYIGSYNWHGTATRPTMLVPGSPRILVDKQTPFVLQPDVGSVPCNYNGRMSPSAPMLPTVLAVEVMTPEFDWSSVDFMTDRNGLRKLMQWVTGTKPDFRLDFHLLGERTVLSSGSSPGRRCRPADMVCPLRMRSRGKSQAFKTRKAITVSLVVLYFQSLGALKVVVRYEVDACAAPDPVEDLTTSFADQSLQGPTPLKTVSVNRSDTISVIKLGRAIYSQDRIVELTSTSSEASSSKYMQMYLSQTPQMVIGFHERGRFTSAMRRGIYPAFEERAQAKLKMLRAVMEMLQAMVIAEGAEGRFSLVWHEGRMEVSERTKSTGCLPESYRNKFWVLNK